MSKEDWEFFNTFAGWAAALGTLAVVIVSLRLARRAEKVRLRVHSGLYRMVAMGQAPAQAPQYFQIGAVNAGSRDATIQGLMWDYRPLLRRRKRLVMVPGGPGSTPVPARLQPTQQATFLFPLDQFEIGAKDLVALLREARYPKLAVRRLRAGVYTTTGEEVLRRLDGDMRAFFLEKASQAAA